MSLSDDSLTSAGLPVQARGLYNPFESGLKCGGADVYLHEMPGGQYTNLKFQSEANLGVGSSWAAIKTAYAAANRLCGDIVKVTPSSKVVGDLAQFMARHLPASRTTLPYHPPVPPSRTILLTVLRASHSSSSLSHPIPFSRKVSIPVSCCLLRLAAWRTAPDVTRSFPSFLLGCR